LAAWSDLLVDDDLRVARWAGEWFGIVFVPPCKAIGFLKGGELVGAAIFNGYTGNDIELTFIGHGLLSRRTLRLLAQWAFVAHPCVRATARTRADNTEAIAALTRGGFVQEGRLRKHFGNCDALVFGILKEDCKWLLAPSAQTRGSSMPIRVRPEIIRSAPN